jgi:hypothetical protein
MVHVVTVSVLPQSEPPADGGGGGVGADGQSRCGRKRRRSRRRTIPSASEHLQSSSEEEGPSSDTQFVIPSLEQAERPSIAHLCRQLLR